MMHALDDAKINNIEDYANGMSDCKINYIVCLFPVGFPILTFWTGPLTIKGCLVILLLFPFYRYSRCI